LQLKQSRNNEQKKHMEKTPDDGKTKRIKQENQGNEFGQSTAGTYISYGPRIAEQYSLENDGRSGTTGKGMP